MTTVSATAARKNIYRLIDDVTESSMPVMITNKNGNNAVLISQEDWLAIEETIFINSIPGMADSIIEASKEPIDLESVYSHNEVW